MATNNILVVVGKQIIFADHATDFVGGASGTSLEVATATDVQIDLTGVAAAGARQSAKFDFGEARAAQYNVMAAFEFQSGTPPVSGETVDLYLGPSNQSVAGDGNPGGCTGTDAAYTGTAGDSLADSLLQLQPIGAYVATADVTGTVQIAFVGVFSSPTRYGSLVVVNNTAAAMMTDATEIHVIFDPIIDDIAAAA